MKAFWTLYWKELRSNKVMIFFIIIGIYGISSFLNRGILRTSETLWILDDMNVYIFSTAVLFVFPLILFYMITSERRENSKYLLFSLPIKRYWIILSNFFVVMSYVVFIPLGFIIIIIISPLMIELLSKRIQPSIYYKWGRELLHIPVPDILKLYFSNMVLFLPLLLMLSGIMSCMELCTSVLKRYRIALGTVFVITLLLLFFSSYQIFSWACGDLFKSLPRYGGSMIERFILNWHMAAVGILYLFIGLILFEKYSDV